MKAFVCNEFGPIDIHKVRGSRARIIGWPSIN